jgi:hypothetical protein
VRGGLTLVAGVATGAAIGFLRVALTAYLLGTHRRADSLAVALGPLDTFNSILNNSLLFAFVPMLTAAAGAQRLALFRRLIRGFAGVFSAIALLALIAAPWLMRALAPGLPEPYFADSVDILRILSFSTLFVGVASVYSSLLFTERRFAPTAFFQAALNVCTILCALLFWKTLGVYAFAVGYTTGAAAQLVIVYIATRRQRAQPAAVDCDLRLHEILLKPAFFAVYAVGDARRFRHGGRARLLHARRGRAHGTPGDADLELAAARVGPPPQPWVDAQRAPVNRSHRRAHCPGGGMRVRVRAAVPQTGNRAIVPARQLYLRFDAPGRGGLSRARPESHRLDTARDHGTRSLRVEPPLAAGHRGHNSRVSERRGYITYARGATGVVGPGRDVRRDGRVSCLVCNGAYGPAALAEGSAIAPGSLIGRSGIGTPSPTCFARCLHGGGGTGRAHWRVLR